MKHFSKKSFKLIVIIFLIVSCNTKQQKKTDPADRIVEIDSNAVIKLITPDSTTDSLEKIVRLMGIHDIKSNRNETQIRIWFEYALSDSGKLIILEEEGKKWHSVAYYYKYNTDDSSRVVSIEKRTEKNEPKSGWLNFLKELDNLGIYKIKNYDEIPKYSSGTDGDYMFIEIWRNNQYKKYEYPAYSDYFTEIELPDMKNVKSICQLIQNEFGYKIMQRPK